MRRNIFAALLSAVLFCLWQIASAVPAKPGKVKFTQPDGSTVTIILHGDEWFHYATDEMGQIMEENAEGFMVKSSSTIEDLEKKMTIAKAAKAQVMQDRQEIIAKAAAKGSPKIPVVLVEFSNKAFTISDPKTAFTNLLNQRGYTANGGTGSVLDYYIDQSRGTYTPEFVVMDVVTLSGTMSTYGSTDENAAKALYEACQSLDATVDFSQFDNDKDGYIDMSLLYFAGYNEAEGGPSSTIWPHQFYVPYVVTNAKAFDGVKLDRYFCTSELKGYSGKNMCGIGTTCHEFAHSLGLPDFYDTNYNEYGDGEAGATYSFDVMCSGSYNNGGCTPPWMNSEELIMLGWAPSTCIQEITKAGSYTLPSISATTPLAYKTPTSASGEYFLYECRSGNSWDKYVSAGMIVYHVDKSKNHSVTWKTSSSGSRTDTAYNLWNNWESYNAINCNGSHPCFYIVPAGSQSSLNYGGSAFAFPGTSNIKTYAPKDWDTQSSDYSLSDIAYSSSASNVTFTLVNNNESRVDGSVMDSDGKPIQGATVTISAGASTSSHVMLMSIAKAAGDVLFTATTGADGKYSFTLTGEGTYIVKASKDGYVSKSVSLQVDRLVIQNFYLLREGETPRSEIYTYPEGQQEWSDYGSSSSSSWSYMCANYYPASFLAPYVGKQIKSISFEIAGTETTTGSVNALVDFGTTRMTSKAAENVVTNGWTTVDLSDLELIIPENKEIYAGYALNKWTYSYPFTACDPASSELVGYMISSYNLNSTSWSAWTSVFKIKLEIGDYVPPQTGYSFIANPGQGIYSVGDEFELTLDETSSDKRPDAKGIQWFFDDEPVSGKVTLKTAGKHVVSALFTTVEGKEKEVELEISVR